MAFLPNRRAVPGLEGRVNGETRVRGPAMAPEFERAAATLEPEARLVKVNVDEEPTLAQRFQVRSIPTILIALHGRELARVAGARSAAQLVEWVRRELSRLNVHSN